MGEIIGDFIVEVVFKGLIIGFFKLIKFIGICTIKILTFSKLPIKELQAKYKKSVIPTLLGLAMFIAIIYAILMLT